MTPTYRVVGQRHVRAEAWSRATGAAQYTADLKLPGQLVGKILGSTQPHARILNIDVRAAASLPGVKTIITAADTPRVRFGRLLKQEVVFAREKVRYVGEPVAAVAAIDDHIAEEALCLIRVDYEELPAVFDPLLALEAGAPLVHEDLATYPDATGSEKWGNVRAHSVYKKGDIERGFEEADVIHEAQYTVPAQHAVSIEPHAALATAHSNGKITVWASTKAPFLVRSLVAEALQIPLSHLRVITPALGGDFGGKGTAGIEAICCLLALHARRPVKLVLTRREEMMIPHQRHAAVIDLKVGVRRDGTLTAVSGRIVYNGGAYTVSTGPMAEDCANLQGVYRVPNVSVEGFNVFTNSTPSGNVRAPGAPQVSFAVESAMEVLARKLGMDPLEFRRKNAVESGDPMPSGKGVLQNVALKQTIDEVRIAAEAIEMPSGSARGFACGFWSVRPAKPIPAAGAWVKLNDDGTVALVTGVAENGGGQHTVLTQIVAEGLGLQPSDVAVVSADTDGTPVDGGTGGSQTTVRAGNIVRLATQDVREQLLSLAALALEANRGDLEMQDKQVFVRGTPERGLSFKKLAGLGLNGIGGPITGTGLRQREDLYSDQSRFKGVADGAIYCTHLAEVQVDVETGQVDVSRYVSCQDVGFALNPLQVEGQIQGAAVFGLGYGLTEQIIRERGATVNDNLADYRIPTSLDVPSIQPVVVEEPSSFGPFGAKGCGEPGVAPVAPAIANAVYRATGVEVRDLPITPEKIYLALKRRQDEGGTPATSEKV